MFGFQAVCEYYLVLPEGGGAPRFTRFSQVRLTLSQGLVGIVAPDGFTPNGTGET